MVRAALEKLGIPESSPLVSEFVARYERDRPFSYLEGEKKAQAILDNVRIELRREVQVALRDGRYPAEKTRGLVEFLDREIETAGPGVDGELRYQRKVLAQRGPEDSGEISILSEARLWKHLDGE